MEDERIIPYYQPILSVNNGEIFGYEVLGRFREADNRIKSLGPFFGSLSIPTEEKLRVNRIIRRKAFSLFSPEQSFKLFININPSWLLDHLTTNSILPSLAQMEEMGVHGENVVIEITEEVFEGDFDSLNILMNRYRSAGCKIAIDDFTFMNFDRLIHLKPDFVKIDMALLRKIKERSEYKKLIHSISSFAQDIGISVLFEGVESHLDLENSMEAGGSHVQGYLLGEPEGDFAKTIQAKNLIQAGIARVTSRIQKHNESILKLESDLNRWMIRFVQQENLPTEEGFKKLLEEVPENCFRAYVCNNKGVQKSPNYTRNAESVFTEQIEFAGMNWGWRPYFFNNTLRSLSARQGIVSYRYIDVETKMETVTFTYPLSSELFLFLDFQAD